MRFYPLLGEPERDGSLWMTQEGFHCNDDWSVLPLRGCVIDVRSGQSHHLDSAPRTSALLRSADIADRGASGPKSAKGGSRRSHSIAAPDVSDELISYCHERKTGEQVRSPTIHYRPSCRATLQGERASQWRLEAHHDDPGAPVSRVRRSQSAACSRRFPSRSQLFLIVTGTLLLSPRKMTAIGDLYRLSGLR